MKHSFVIYSLLIVHEKTLSKVNRLSRHHMLDQGHLVSAAAVGPGKVLLDGGDERVVGKEARQPERGGSARLDNNHHYHHHHHLRDHHCHNYNHHHHHQIKHH